MTGMTDETWEGGLREVMAGTATAARVATPPTEAILRRGRSSLRRRNGLAGSGVLGVVAAAVIAGTSLGAGSAGGPAPQAGVVSAGAAVVTLGPASAKTKVVVYDDYRCPPCRQTDSGTSAFLEQEAGSGRIQVEYRPVNLIDRSGTAPGSGSMAAGNAVQCAAEHGDFSAYRAAVFAHQPTETVDAFTASALIAIAREIPGLDTAAFEKCVGDQPYAAAINRNYDSAFTTVHCEGVPCITVDGKQWTGSVPAGADLGKIVDSWLVQEIAPS
ncbi:protein-disulfide isomerase [Catenulispora sp. MAP5-51]|uniref:DsbA family protein n=1 Tax=Catenulispora sp. MAP5-51 TaxID=3156298 RepID=UPI0035137E78